MILALPEVVICPNVLVLRFVLGSIGMKRFVTLKASARNSSLLDSRIWKIRASAISNCQYPGPSMLNGRIFPNVPGRSEDASQLPARGELSQHRTLKLRRWNHACHIEDLTPVHIVAIAAVEIPIIGIEISGAASAGVVCSRIDRDAMGPGVICANSPAFGCAALNREQQSVIVLRAGIFSGKQVPIELSVRWVL